MRTHHWYVTPRFEIGKIWEIERVTSNFRLLPASLVSAVRAVFSQQQSDRAVEVAAGAAVDPSLPRHHLLINRVIDEFIEKKTPKREAWS